MKERREQQIAERYEGRADERVTSTEANEVVKEVGKTDRKPAQQKQAVDGKDKTERGVDLGVRTCLLYTSYGMETTCMPIEGADLELQLAEAVKNIHGSMVSAVDVETELDEMQRVFRQIRMSEITAIRW